MILTFAAKLWNIFLYFLVEMKINKGVEDNMCGLDDLPTLTGKLWNIFSRRNKRA